MVYSKHEWQSGELITSAKLNNIEKNIILSAKKRHITYGKLMEELVH